MNASPNKKQLFKVRPSQSSKPKEALRVYLSSPSLLILRLRPGALCQLHYGGNSTHPAIAWAATGKLGDSVAQVSDTLKALCNFTYGQEIEITRIAAALEEVNHVLLRDLSAVHGTSLEEEDRLEWQFHMAVLLSKEVETVAIGQEFSTTFRGQTRGFQVRANNLPAAGIAKVSENLRVSIRDGADHHSTMTVNSSGLGGIDDQLKQIQSMIFRLTTKPSVHLPAFYKPSQGLLLYGAKGTGKTLLIERIAACAWGMVYRRWIPGQPIPMLDRSPSLIVIVDLESPSGGVENRHSSSAASVRSLFDAIRGQNVMVVAETRHPNNIHESLRAPGRFNTEIELLVPASNGRLEILRAIRGDSTQPGDAALAEIAAKTHGYVGADLYVLLQVATDVALERTEAATSGSENCILDFKKLTLEPNGISEHTSPVPSSPVNESTRARTNSKANLKITVEDISVALSKVRPTALQEVFLETPNVRWSDIGGQSGIKKRLQSAVERPLKQADIMNRLNLKPKKGILLYGPPGCSKTLLVKALATETDLNFLAVKGAELISMYVGESERAIREVFRKARAASPSIIFFDEIDSLASSRKSELNVLTTLLNEMDGFEELRNVLVVAATNKPQDIDPALIRPGRLDNILYVGPPDEETRLEILQTWFQKSNIVDVHAADLAGARTEGFSGAELVSVCQTAGEYAMNADRDHITRQDLEKAINDTPRGITSEILAEYQKWHEARQ